MPRTTLHVGLALCLAALTSSDVAAQREGFIIGFGAGPGLTTGGVDSKIGATLSLKVGGMASETVQLYVTSKANFFSEDGALVLAGVHGLGVTQQWPSGFNINGAIGVATWIDFDWSTYAGFGAGVGVGYEFTDNWVIDLGGQWGRREDLNVFNIALTINWMSF